MRKLFLMCVLFAAGLAHGQFLGYTSPQSVFVTLANNVSCTGSSQAYTTGVTAGFLNLGQNSHSIVLSAGSNLGGVFALIQGSNDGSTYVTISDTLTQVNGGVPGYGSFALFRVLVTCNIGSYTLTYSGTNNSFGPTFGAAILQQTDKNLFTNKSAGSNFTTGNYFSPYGNSGGSLIATYAASAGPAGSTLTVNCISQASTPNAVIFGPYTLAASTSVQSFPVPAFPCPLFTVTYTSGGASAQTVAVDYAFNIPGAQTQAQQYSHITGTTATAVKGTPGYLHTLNVNTGGAGTVSIFDLASASCTGTPSTNTVAVVTAVATTLQTFTYDVNLLNGICVKASVAMDLTVSYQ